MTSGIASLLSLLAGALWVMWLGMGLAPVWVSALVLWRFETSRQGHALVWPASWRGSPVIVRAAALGGFLCAGLLVGIESAIWPPLLGPRAGLLAVGISWACALALDLVSFDLLRRGSSASSAALVMACVLLPLRVTLSIAALGAPARPLEELAFPLTLGIWRPLSVFVAPGAFLLEAVLLALAARALRAAPSTELAGSREENEHRRRHVASSVPLLLLGAAGLLSGLLHTDEVGRAVGRWVAH